MGALGATRDGDTGMAHYRALFISDVHLGTRASQAGQLLDFLKEHDADTIYLVGDIVDFWRIKRGAGWPRSNSEVLRVLLQKARDGARMIYIPGNHDEGLRDYCGSRFGGIEIVRDAVHVTASGRRYLVIHGDEMDVVARHARWLALIGDRAYQASMLFNRPLNYARRLVGLDYWSLSAFLKNQVKSAVNAMGNFEQTLIDEAGRRQTEGVICGHIHHAASRTIGDIHYVNCGDWVESCTAVVETAEGAFELVRWREVTAERASAGAELRELEAAA